MVLIDGTSARKFLSEIKGVVGIARGAMLQGTVKKNEWEG